MTSQEYKSGSVILAGHGPLLKLESKDVYAVGTPAMVAVGTSGKGKTVAAVDMAYANADVATHFVYMTGTYDTPANQYLRQRIPEIYVKNPDFQLMCDIWGDTLQRSSDFVKFTRPDMVDRFISTRASNTLALRSEVDTLRRTVEENAVMFPDRSSLEQALQVKITNLKLDFIAKSFTPNDYGLLPEEKEFVSWARSTRPCPVYIFDDITAVFSNPPRETLNIPFPGEGDTVSSKPMKGADAVNFLLMNMLTTIRHFGVAGFFVHSLGAFDANIRTQFGSIMFVGKEGVSEMLRQRTVSIEDKKLIQDAFEVAEKYPYYKAMYFQNPDQTPHGQRVALFKPTYYGASRPIGVETYRTGIQNVMDAIGRNNATSSIRTAIEGEKMLIQQQVDMLARDGALLEKPGALLEKPGALLEKPGALLEKPGALLETSAASPLPSFSTQTTAPVSRLDDLLR